MSKIRDGDVIGHRFGRLVALSLDEEATANNKNHAHSFLCQCDCGNQIVVRGQNLLNGSTKSCGCLCKKKCSENGKNGTIDLTGQKFGKLTVTRKKENDPNDPIKQRRIGAWWYCDCDCGTKDVVAKGSYLRAGRVKSCGCYNKEATHIANTVDITGQKFGMLTAIEEVPGLRKSGAVAWRCVCDCGNEAIVSGNALRTGNTISCGCLSSKNEFYIREFLTKNNIKHEKQYYFDDLRSPITGWLLKFDVAVLDEEGNLSFLIEYDGEQHEYGTRYSHDADKNAEKFERLQLYDSLKNEYCEKHNIDLFRISFRDKDSLYDLLRNKLIEKGLLKEDTDGIVFQS